MKNFSYSHEVARRSESNFYWSFYFLPPQKRRGILTIYAFSRLVDDAVDEAPNEETARQEIADWRKRLDLCFDKKDILSLSKDHPILPELAETVRRFEIPKTYLLDLLTGVEMDLEKKRYATFAELEKYCYHVAGTIGLLCNRLFGISDERGKEYAILLGTAFQLTNILRDVGSDARRGRIYLPQEELKKFGLSDSDLLKAKASPAFFDLMKFQATRAEDFYAQAFQVLPQKLRQRIIPSEMMTGFYRSILKKLRQENFPVFEKKVSLTGREKLGIAVKSILSSLL